MKCGNENPKCQNCEANNKECIYIEVVKKPRSVNSILQEYASGSSPLSQRPSNARIDHLEKENRVLQEALRLSLERDKEPKSQEQINAEAPPPNGAHKSQIGLEARPKSQLRVSEKQAHSREFSNGARERLRNVSSLPSSSVNKESRYHGPTSAMFDEKSTERGTQRKAVKLQVSEEWVKSLLMAEATKQRTSETPSTRTISTGHDSFCRKFDEGQCVIQINLLTC